MLRALTSSQRDETLIHYDNHLVRTPPGSSIAFMGRFSPDILEAMGVALQLGYLVTALATSSNTLRADLINHHTESAELQMEHLHIEVHDSLDKSAIIQSLVRPTAGRQVVDYIVCNYAPTVEQKNAGLPSTAQFVKRLNESIAQIRKNLSNYHGQPSKKPTLILFSTGYTNVVGGPLGPFPNEIEDREFRVMSHSDRLDAELYLRETRRKLSIEFESVATIRTGVIVNSHCRGRPNAVTHRVGMQDHPTEHYRINPKLFNFAFQAPTVNASDLGAWIFLHMINWEKASKMYYNKVLDITGRRRPEDQAVLPDHAPA